METDRIVDCRSGSYSPECNPQMCPGNACAEIPTHQTVERSMPTRHRRNVYGGATAGVAALVRQYFIINKFSNSDTGGRRTMCLLSVFFISYILCAKEKIGPYPNPIVRKPRPTKPAEICSPPCARLAKFGGATPMRFISTWPISRR